MTEKLDPRVPLTLDKERTLLLNLNAMVAYQKTTGKNLLKPDGFDMENPEDLRAFLWACLIHDDKTLTLETAGALVNPANIGAINLALVKTFTAAMPEVDKEQPGPLPPAPPPTG